MRAFDEELDQLLDDCIDREERLTDWERGFIDSLSDCRAGGYVLTAKQINKLNSIWERVTENG